MKNNAMKRNSERGSAGTKFLLVFAGILLIGHAGYNYVPVAYEAESMKTEMQTAVVQGLALPARVNPVENVKSRIMRAAQINSVPDDVLIEVKQTQSSMSAHVVYAKQINMLPFGMFKYNYQFDHTATPVGFLLKQ
jgi:hypothetical protein